jgi:hypothetical protein
LFTGASGGVGTASVQYGKSMGLIVVALSHGEEKRSRLLELGSNFAFNVADKNLRNTVSAGPGGIKNHNRVTWDRRRLTSRPSHYLHARRAPPNGNAATQIYGPPTSPNPISGPGLRFSWIVYRRKVSAVTFRPDQFKTWTDTRAWANSPWSPPFTIPEPPPEGRWVTKVTFDEPGIYVLRALSDGSLFTYEHVSVAVAR